MRATIRLDKPTRAALADVGQAIPSRSTLPCALYMGTSANGNGTITVHGTNLDVAIVTTIKATIAEPGELGIPYRELMAALKACPKDTTVTITTGPPSTDRNLVTTMPVHLATPHATVRLEGIPFEDLPPIPDHTDATHVADMPADRLRDALSMVEHAIATDESRPVLHCACLAFTKHMLRAVAADGFRLAWHDTPADVTTGVTILLPRPSVNAIIRTLPRNATASLYTRPSPATVGAYQPHTLIITAGDYRAAARLAEGTFPNYEQIVPNVMDAMSVTALAPAWLAALKALPRTDSGMVRIVPNGTSLDMLVRNSGEDIGRATVPAIIRGDPHPFAVNDRYLEHALLTIGNAGVTLAQAKATDPMLLVDDRETYREVIMPMHVRDNGRPGY